MNALVNYSNLFNITLPETILEVVSLLVLIVDLSWLRKASKATRMASACLLGVAGSAAAILWLLAHPESMSVAAGALVATPLVSAAQIGILILTALVLLLSVKPALLPLTSTNTPDPAEVTESDAPLSTT